MEKTSLRSKLEHAQAVHLSTLVRSKGQFHLERQRNAHPGCAPQHARASRKGEKSLRVRDKHAPRMPDSMPVLSTRKISPCNSEASTPRPCPVAHPCQVGDAYRIVGDREDSTDDEEDEVVGGASFGADRFQSIEIMYGSLDSRMDTLQGQLQTVIQLLQPYPPPPPEP
ncbi:hypothetical protein JCGZ_05149 [Jatropha curcas]|uniref:Uncharacterized protein n=1 Tax=Jatropha curcas TaxID=180498 RepID=A0A067KWU3_JATCU|nr:hypothetical protein JCGZ_05149 [Jatropha curcas]